MNCKEFEDILDEFYQGELPEESHGEVEQHMLECSLCRQMYTEYEQMSVSLQNLGILSCPPDVISNVLATIADEEVSRKGWFGDFFSNSMVWYGIRYASAAVALILVVAVFMIPGLIKEPTGPVFYATPHYSQAEVEKAYEDVKTALVYVNVFTRKTRTIISKEVLQDGVLEPIQSSMNKAFKPIINGDV